MAGFGAATIRPEALRQLRKSARLRRSDLCAGTLIVQRQRAVAAFGGAARAAVLSGGSRRTPFDAAADRSALLAGHSARGEHGVDCRAQFVAGRRDLACGPGGVETPAVRQPACPIEQEEFRPAPSARPAPAPAAAASAPQPGAPSRRFPACRDRENTWTQRGRRRQPVQRALIPTG